MTNATATAAQLRQHVQIAEGLLEQYPDALARFMAAWKESEDAEMSVTRAEVERVYTGLWEQLDAAARLTEGAGRAADRFRELRATPGLEVGAAIFDTRERVAGVTPGLRGTKVTSELTVQHNTHGVELARQAVRALQAAWPELDWTPPETPDVDLRPGGLGRLVVGIGRWFKKSR